MLFPDSEDGQSDGAFDLHWLDAVVRRPCDLLGIEVPHCRSGPPVWAVLITWHEQDFDDDALAAAMSAVPYPELVAALAFANEHPEEMASQLDRARDLEAECPWFAAERRIRWTRAFNDPHRPPFGDPHLPF